MDLIKKPCLTSISELFKHWILDQADKFSYIDTMSEIEILKFEESDADNLIRWINTPSASDPWASRTYKFPLAKETVIRHIERTSHTPVSLMVFKIRKLGHTVGHVELDNFDHLGQSVRITRLFIDPKYRSSGIGKSATKFLLKLCFNELNMNRVEILAIESNLPALRLYEGIGFFREGFLRENMVVSEKRQGSFLLSMLRSEYQTGEQ